MKQTTKDFLNLFFKPGEEICFSHNKYAYPSDKQEEINEDNTVLVAINPITGQRNDQNVTAYRSFLVECDDMPLAEQMEYIKKMDFPYSYCCFSGGKSLHFGLVLDHDIPSEHIYRHTYQWILNILTEADQNTKNPSRSIRFPGVIRPEKNKEQRLVHMGNRISLDTLSKWLNKYPNKTPKPFVAKVRNTGSPNVQGIGMWAKTALKEGVQNGERGRNQTWMAIGCEMAMNGFELDDTVAYLEKYFEEESDFRQQEWLSAVKSGWKYADVITSKR